MTNLSATTAQSLKLAKFPQPIPADGQCWYFFGNDRAFTMNEFSAPNIYSQMEYEGKEKLFTFCPTAEDILRELPNECRVGKIEEGFSVVHYYYYNRRCAISVYTGATLSEALATAYLALNPPPAP
jgi:hypothetical protein